MAAEAGYDDIAEWYETEFLAVQRAAGDDEGYADRIGIDRALAELLGQGRGLCLDLGCGTGIYAERIRSLGRTPIGVDLSSGMLSYARSRLPVAQGDGGRLPLRSGSVPAAVSVMTHTDLPDYRPWLEEVRRVLMPGGRFVHIGVHPCFCGRFADRTEPPTVVINPGYLEGGWVAGRGLDAGRVGTNGQVRDKVGASHLPLADLVNLVLDCGFTLDRVAEGAAPTPITLSLRAIAI